MNWKIMITLFYKKQKSVAIGFFLLLSFIGVYALNSVVYFYANKEKWDVLERMGEDYYYYASNTLYENHDKATVNIERNFGRITMDYLVTKDTYDAFICSSETWELFDYKLKAGNDFSKESKNEVIVSRGLEAAYPIGTMMKIDLYHKDSLVKYNVEKTIKCKVVGVIEQNSVFCRRPVGRGSLENDLSMQMSNSNLSITSATLNTTYCILNPMIKINNPDNYLKSSGMFFKATKEEVEELNDLFRIYGKVYSNDELKKEVNPIYKGEIRTRILFLIGIIFLGILYIVIWISVLFKQSEREFSYWMYINANMKKMMNQFYCIPFAGLPFALILSFIGYLLPNELETFWKMDSYMSFVVLGIQIVVCGLGSLILIIIMRSGHIKKIAEYFKYCDEKNLFIDELSVMENLILILQIQCYSPKSSRKIIYKLLEEKKIMYCKNRNIWRLSAEEKMNFNKIKDKLLR